MKARDEILSLRRESVVSQEVKNIIIKCIKNAYENSSFYGLGISLAATFDLMVSAAYYNSISNRGWTYCCKSPQMMFYTYTNICPRCIGNGQFVYAKANKPESGRIGQITTEILCLFFQYMLERKGARIDVFKCSEPIDVVVHDLDCDMFLLAEVKAAPLLTLPIVANCDRLTETIDGSLTFSGHMSIDNPNLSNTKMNLYIPRYGDVKEEIFPLELRGNIKYKYYDAIYNLISTDVRFYRHYLDFWYNSFMSYTNKDKQLSLYWLTNACGTPSPIPENWPKRKESGYESVSDSKTSAGMDRTDDIKKGIYQVLKLGAEYKTKYENVRTAIISNLPAIRHYDEYLLTIKDIVWTMSNEPYKTKLGELPFDASIYNLFDGIISLTKSDIRDMWVKNMFSKI